MVKRYFDTEHGGRAVTVTMGWDRPLNSFYMDIAFQGEDDSDPSSYLYSHLTEAQPFGLPLDHFRDRLSLLGLTIPERMLEEVQKDAHRDIPFGFLFHFADGRIETTDIAKDCP